MYKNKSSEIVLEILPDKITGKENYAFELEKRQNKFKLKWRILVRYA